MTDAHDDTTGDQDNPLESWSDEQLRQAREKAEAELQRRGQTAEARQQFEREIAQMSDAEFNRMAGKLR